MSISTILLSLSVWTVALCSERASLGPYNVLFDSQGLPSITVYSTNSPSPDRVVWSTPSSTDQFVIAEQVQQTVSQNGGDYIIRETVLDNCSDAVLSSFHADDHVISISGRMCQQYDVQITFTLQSYDHLGFNVSLLHTNHFNKITLIYGCGHDEGVYGLGQQYTYVNNRGYSVPLFISEQGVGRGAEPITTILNQISPGSGGNAYTTYSRVPFYFTSLYRALYMESLDYAVLHLTENNTIKLEINSTEITGRIFTGDSFMNIIESFTAFAGRMSPLPDWVHDGAILGLQGGTKIVSGVLDQVEKVMGSLEDVVGVWLQDWTGQRNVTGTTDLPRTALWWNWEVDRQHYPGWEEFVAKLNSKGIRVLTYINPLFNNVSKRGSPCNHNYYEEGLEEDYFIKHGPSKEVWYGYSNSHMVDLTNQNAYDWIMEMIIQNMIATNISGWMCDFGESVPLDAILQGTPAPDPAQYHTVYSQVWGQLNMEAIQKAIDRSIITREQASDIVYFMRSGSTHSPRVTPLFWLGDQMVTWDEYDGLGSAITGAINSGLSGQTLTHSDIGGYTSIKIPLHLLSYIRSEELLMRWCEFSAFTVIYRSHLGTLPDENAQFYSNTNSMKHYFRMARVYKAWKFYRDQLIQEAVERGWPVMRHMMLVYPANPSMFTEDLRYQYMLGTEILVAPIHVKGAESTPVFLPGNITWINVWNKASVEGNNKWKTFPAPMGHPVAFYPKGSDVGEKFADNLSKFLGSPDNQYHKAIQHNDL